jgi:predicted GTPase
MTDLQTEFPIQVDIKAGHPEAIKWTIEKEKYEIHQTILEKVEIGEILTHCLQVVHKINTEVGYNEKKLVKSYMQVLPRTFSIPLTATWDQIAEEFPMDEETLANFNNLLRHFFKAHSTDDDRHDLLTQIRNTCLPKQMKTQSFFYRLRELNHYVDWIPGHEPKLTEDQLNLAFYTGM